MRKNYFLKSAIILLCPILLLSCSKDDDPEVVPEVEEAKNLLSVTLAQNYFPNVPDVEYTGTVYLTNQEGEVISSGELENGLTTELQEIYDLTTEKLNLSFVRKIVHPGGISYRINTYTNVDPYVFSFENTMVQPRIDKATVQIRNTGSMLESSVNHRPFYSGTVSTNEATLDIPLNEDPGHLFFTVKNETEDFRRYFLQKNVTAGSEISVEFQELTPITNHLTMKFPENGSLIAYIRGAESTEPNNFYATIAEARATDGRTSHTFPIPEDLFQRFKLRLILQQDQKQYVLDAITTSLEEQYDFPNWELQSSSAGNAFSLTSTNTANFYSAGFQYVPADQPYDVVWTVTGEKTNEMEFILPELQEFIAQDISNFSLEDLNLRSATLIRIEGISNYKDLIMSREDDFSSEKEAITRSENLITFF